MIAFARLFRGLAADTTGGMLIETAIVAPVLILMSLGAFQVSELVARQNELQSAMSVAQSIALVSDPDDSTKRTQVQQIITATTGLTSDKVIISAAYKCSTGGTTYLDTNSSCTTGQPYSSYVKIELKDTYTPMWNDYGIGKPIALDLVRYVMYRQKTKS
jgi:Flp pilus assembly protein TadG